VIANTKETKAEREREYEEAAAGTAGTKELSKDEGRELQTLFKKRARLYHPDRYAQEPEKQEVYVRLMQEVNQARDRGDITTPREIANDPNGLLLQQGMSAPDFDDDEELAKLRQLYESLQERILTLLDELERLRESGDSELYKLSRERPDFVQEVADQQAEAIAAEIAELEVEAEQLAEEIKWLTGTADPFEA
jgi:DNA polymerase-3 subunit epsilon